MRISDWRSDVWSSERADLGDRLLDASLAARAVGHVAFERDAADLVRGLLGQVQIHVEDGDLGARLGEFLRGGGPQTRSAAGDDCAYALQLHDSSSRLFVCTTKSPVSSRSGAGRSEEHTSVQSLMRISYAVFCLKKKKNTQRTPS